MNQQNQVEQIIQEEAVVVIPQELVTKFDGDKELVQKFMEHGYSMEELSSSTITHPTYSDPVVTLKNGKVAGFWL